MSAERPSLPRAKNLPEHLPEHLPEQASEPLSRRSWLHRRLQAFEKNPTLGWAVAGGWMACVVLLAFFLGLGSIGLVDETEPLFAEAARQMILRDNWVTPYFNEATRFDKPPLIYWLMAIAYKLFGVNEWAVRLPSALSATVLVGFVLYVLQQHGIPAFGPRTDPEAAPPTTRTRPAYSRWFTALLGVGLTAFNLETIAWGRIGVSDMLLSGCFGSALLTFFLGYATPKEKKLTQTLWYVNSYVWIALAILAKGPVGIVLPGIIVLGFLIYVGQLWPTLREMKLWLGLPLMGLITIPWHVLVIQANGEAYTRSFFGYHNFQRFTETVNNHGAPWYFYFLVVLVGFAPWSMFLPTALHRLRLWRRREWVEKPRSAQLGVFAAAWFVGVFVFFTVAATKLPSYVLPLMPAAAILVALLFSDEMTRPLRTAGLKISGWFNFGFALVLTGAIATSFLWIQVIEDPAMPNFPQALRDSSILIWGAAICLEVAIALYLLLRRRRTRWLWAVNLVGFVAILLCVLPPATALMDQHRQAPLRQLAASLVAQRQPQEELIMVGFEKPSLVFYSQQPMTFFRRTRSTFRHLQEFSFQQPAPETVLILTHPDRIERLGLTGLEYSVLDQAGAYVLLRVPKQTFRDRLSREPQALGLPPGSSSKTPSKTPSETPSKTPSKTPSRLPSELLDKTATYINRNTVPEWREKF